MAVTGLLLIGFVLMHLSGNLLVFAGPYLLNVYAEKHRHVPALLWTARVVLLAALIAHVVITVQLAAENRRARPHRYGQHQTAETTFAARTMMLSGLLLLAYLAYHLLHFTFRVTNPELSHGVDAFGRHDVYAMVVGSFRRPLISLVYVVGMAVVCAHLSHGIGSVFQTLGVANAHVVEMAARVGRLLAVGLFVAYCSIPVAVMAGLVQ